MAEPETTHWACATCGVEHPTGPNPPAGDCAICSDERQYLPEGGQRWSTLTEIQDGRSVELREMEPNLIGLFVTPSVGIGHRPLLLKTDGGNVLWDPPGTIDDDLISALEDHGEIAAIACSHPHLTGFSVTFSHAFGKVPIWYNAADAAWIRRPDPVIRLWQGQQEVLPGLTLYQCGGHFEGSAVLHWPDGYDGKGVILVGDTVRPSSDRRTVSFMRSYPNLIPLPPKSIRRIANVLEPLAFERIYGGFNDILWDNGQAAVQYSADRYIRWITD